ARLWRGACSAPFPEVHTVAVLPNEPVAVAEMLQAAVDVTPPPLHDALPILMLPEPEAVHVPPPAPTQVHVQVSAAGNVSATVEPGAALGPAFAAVIV